MADHLELHREPDTRRTKEAAVSDVIRLFEARMAARRKLERIADGSNEHLSPNEATLIVESLKLDSDRIESLLRSLPDDD